MQQKVLAMGSAEDIFEALEQVNSAIAGASDSKEMLVCVLDAMLEIFDCDRSWLLYPCLPTTDTYTVPMERTRPDWPGAAALNIQLPTDDATRGLFGLALDQKKPIRFDSEESPADISHPTLKTFQVKSQLIMALFPVGDEPWMLGIHHCREERIYKEILPLFRAVGRRLADGLGRHLALSHVRKSEERFRVLVEHAPEAIVLIDCRTGLFVDVNPNAERLFGLTREQLLERGPAALSPEFQKEGGLSSELLSEHLKAALAGEVPSVEWTFRNRDGQPLVSELRLIKLPGDPVVRGSITDIAARKHAEKEREELREQLVQAQKMEALGQLTGGIAHDFNNLLTVIFGNVDLLLVDPSKEENVVSCARRIDQAAKAASTLTHRLLAFARKQPLRPSVFDAGALLRDMDEMLRRTLGESVGLEIVVGGGLWTCSADPAQLENAILNLAINARHAMPEGGRLTIEASNARLDRDYAREHPEVLAGQYVLFAVTDSGTGMPPEIVDQVFAPFFTTKPPGKGSGLGLSMVFGFVKQSGGHVKIYSEVGHGTTVKIYLPRGAGAVSSLEEDGADELLTKGKGEVVLVVEDDSLVRSVIEDQLKNLGYKALTTQDGDEALELLNSHFDDVQLLLTDVILSDGIGGRELVERALRLRPNLPIVYMSGYTENSIIHNGHLTPGVELLEKPFERETLARSVGRALKSRRSD